MTMKAALETLGIPTWHWVTMSENTVRLYCAVLQSNFSEYATNS